MFIWDDFKQLSNLALKKIAQAFNGRKVNPRCGFVVKGCDGAAVQPSLLGNIRDTKFIAPHEGGQMTANHVFLLNRQLRVLRSVALFCTTDNPELVR